MENHGYIKVFKDNDIKYFVVDLKSICFYGTTEMEDESDKLC